jgi:hypothetical protein
VIELHGQIEIKDGETWDSKLAAEAEPFKKTNTIDNAKPNAKNSFIFKPIVI